MTTSTPPPTASVMDTPVSNGVSMLKWDGTRRHACRVMPATSSTQSAANSPSSTVRVRTPVRRYEEIQPTAMSVRPKERPKVTGLRHDTGPSQEPPSTTRTTRCTRPDAMSTAPVA